jgi:transcriptional regulator with XRE-family HTH domain
MKKTTTEEDNYLINIGLRIKEFRKKNNITQGDLAKSMGTSQPQVARIETGEQNASILIYKRIATILGVAIEDLVKE